MYLHQSHVQDLDDSMSWDTVTVWLLFCVESDNNLAKSVTEKKNEIIHYFLIPDNQAFENKTNNQCSRKTSTTITIFTKENRKYT